MSFNQHPDPQDLSKQTSNSQTQGHFQPWPSILAQAHHDSDHQDPSIQNSNAQTPTTRQPLTLPSIAATCGVSRHPGHFNFGPHYPSNNSNPTAPRSLAQAHVNADAWILESNNIAAAPLHWPQLPSNPSGYNPNHPWNNNNAPAIPNPHPAVASATGHPTAAGYLPSTFTPGPVSARSQELMNGSTPLEAYGQQSGLSNFLDAVGDNRRALRHAYDQLLIKEYEDFTARRKARISNAQTEGADMSQRHRTNSTGTIIVTEQPSRSETVASLAEATRNGTWPPFTVTAPADSETNDESDSSSSTETPGSDEEAEYYDSSVCGEVPEAGHDGEEQDPGADTAAVVSEEELPNEFSPEGELAAVAQATVPPTRFLRDRRMAARDTVSEAPGDVETEFLDVTVDLLARTAIGERITAPAAE